MEVLHERCAGLDVHKNTVVGCVRLGTAAGRGQDENLIALGERHWSCSPSAAPTLGNETVEGIGVRVCCRRSEVGRHTGAA